MLITKIYYFHFTTKLYYTTKLRSQLINSPPNLGHKNGLILINLNELNLN